MIKNDLGLKLNQGKITKVKKIIAKVLVYSALILFAIWILAPFSMVIITSFKTRKEASDPEFHFFPEKWTFEGYKEVFTYVSGVDDSEIPVMLKGFLNTLIIVLPPTLIGLFVSAMSAYAFAKLRFKGKNVLFSALLLTMMIPGTIMLTPSYMIYDMLNWVDTQIGRAHV